MRRRRESRAFKSIFLWFFFIPASCVRRAAVRRVKVFFSSRKTFTTRQEAPAHGPHTNLSSRLLIFSMCYHSVCLFLFFFSPSLSRAHIYLHLMITGFFLCIPHSSFTSVFSSAGCGDKNMKNKTHTLTQPKPTPNLSPLSFSLSLSLCLSLSVCLCLFSLSG